MPIFAERRSASVDNYENMCANLVKTGSLNAEMITE